MDQTEIWRPSASIEVVIVANKKNQGNSGKCISEENRRPEIKS